MRVFIRKVAGETQALIGNARAAILLGPSRHPSLLSTALSFAFVLLFPLIALALTWLALHTGGDHAGLVLAAAPIMELRAKRAKLVKDANDSLTAAQAKAKSENRVLTDEEKAADDANEAKIKALDEEIALEERKLDRERRAGATPTEPTDRRQRASGGRVSDVHLRAEDDPRRGFKTHRHFLLSVIENSGATERADVADERLQPLAVVDDDKKAKHGLAFLLPTGFTPWAAAGSDEHGEYSDPYGGYAVPKSRIPGILQVGFEGDPTENMTQPIPMQTPHVEIMARVDKDHSTSVVGGLVMTRKPETVTQNASRFQLEMVELKATNLFGLAFATENLLADSPTSFAAIIDSGFRTQRSAHILNEKLRGGGGNEYLGVLNSPAKVSVSKQTGQAADTIVGQNVIEMAARVWGPYIWIANHDTKPELYKLNIPVGTSGVLLFQPSLDVGFPDMLLGRPVYYTEYASTVGDEGDLIAWNPSQYLEGIYQPLQSAESVHVRFVEHERAFKFWERNCGAPWWRSALTPNKSAKTLSPIVTLAARA